MCYLSGRKVSGVSFKMLKTNCFSAVCEIDPDAFVSTCLLVSLSRLLSMLKSTDQFVPFTSFKYNPWGDASTLELLDASFALSSQTFPEWASPDREGSCLVDTNFTDGLQTLWCHSEIWCHLIPWQHTFTDMPHGQLKEIPHYYSII